MSLPTNGQQQMLDQWEVEAEVRKVADNGQAARQEGKSLEDNPHMTNSLQWEAWRAGWHRV